MPIAWLFHATVNTSSGFLAIGDHAQQVALSVAVFAVTVLVAIVLAGQNRAREGASEEPEPASLRGAIAR